MINFCKIIFECNTCRFTFTLRFKILKVPHNLPQMHILRHSKLYTLCITQQTHTPNSTQQHICCISFKLFPFSGINASIFCYSSAGIKMNRAYFRSFVSACASIRSACHVECACVSEYGRYSLSYYTE